MVKREHIDVQEDAPVPPQEVKVEPDAAPNRSELRQQRALLVSLMTSPKGIQLVKKSTHLVGLPIPSPIEDMVPLVDGTHVEGENSGADEEHVIQDEASERLEALAVVQALEDDIERKRSCVAGCCANPGEQDL